MGNVPPSALRQPPPPPGRCLLIDSNKVPAPTTSTAEGDRSVSLAASLVMRVRSRPLYFRRCKKGNPSKNSMIESLPDELLMEILMCLSADDIYDKARLVCRRWCHLIHTDAFVCAHFHRSSSGLLLTPFSDPHMRNPPILVTATTQVRVQISELSCRVRFPIMCSCNGLALCLREDGCRGKTPFIFNPATKCAFNLPKFFIGAPLLNRLGIAYAAASMSYKVVGSYCKFGLAHCGILTVGVDNSWRHVAVEGLSPEARWVLMSCPLMTGGFVHWVSETHVVSLNVETEIFKLTPTPALMFPPDYQKSKYGYLHLSTGMYLSLFVSRGDWLWEVWEMKPETWEWRKVLPNIDLEARKCKIQQFASREDVLVRPVGWVRYPEVVAFFFYGTGHFCIIYNLVTAEINSIDLSASANFHCVVQHRNSLVWSERC